MSTKGHSVDLMERTNVRLAIIGCGAIAEDSHLPAALSSPLVELVAVCDANDARLRYIQRQFDLGRAIATSDYRQLFPLVDAVILALPNSLHAPIGCEFLSRGIHVLCEKPLAVTRAECELLCNSAREGGAVLGVGYYTRYYPSTKLTRVLIRSGFLGKLDSFDYEFGTAGGWETQSGYNLTKEESGGGVLVVSGSHFLDRMLYLFDDTTVVSYTDDSRGGVEANCVLTLECKTAGDVITGRVTLSKTHKLANRVRIIGERGALQIDEGQTESVTYYPTEGGIRQELSYLKSDQLLDGKSFFQVELEDFLSAVQSGTKPRAAGEDGMLLAAIFEKCYEIARALDEPWVDTTIPRLRAALPDGEFAALRPKA
jgi:predicted dehydrogenase